MSSLTYSGSGGGGVGIITINGNTGSITGSTVSILGTGPLSSSGSGTTLTFSTTAANSIVTDSGTATASANAFTVVGGSGITTSASGSTVTITATGGGALPVTLIDNTDSPYAVLTADYFIGVDTTAGAVTLLFQNNPAVGTSYIVKDVGGQAEVNNITITTISGLQNFDNTSGNYIMNTEYQSVNLVYVGSSNYYIY